MSEITNIQNAICNYIQRLNVPHSREYSWEHCYELFRLSKGTELSEEKTDNLALNLFAYLASWGMLRNSFLMDYDYKIHKEVVRIILNPKYECLSGVLMKTLDEKKLDLILELRDKIDSQYRELPSRADMKTSDTLISKILLGTLGCLPAYDENVRKRLSTLNIPQSINKDSLNGLIKYWEDNATDIHDVVAQYDKLSTYPNMKILDIVFWETE